MTAKYSTLKSHSYTKPRHTTASHTPGLKSLFQTTSTSYFSYFLCWSYWILSFRHSIPTNQAILWLRAFILVVKPATFALVEWAACETGLRRWQDLHRQVGKSCKTPQVTFCNSAPTFRALQDSFVLLTATNTLFNLLGCSSRKNWLGGPEADERPGVEKCCYLIPGWPEFTLQQNKDHRELESKCSNNGLLSHIKQNHRMV